MALQEITNCPGTLADGYSSYSHTALRRVFQGRKVSCILSYDSPATNDRTDTLFTKNRKRMSISGVQEKFSLLLDKNKLRLVNDGEQGLYRSEEHTSELQSRFDLVCRLLLEKK